MKIKDFFSSINHEIHRAQTSKAVRFLEKRLKKTKDYLINNNLSKSIKRAVLREYKRSQKLINAKLSMTQ